MSVRDGWHARLAGLRRRQRERDLQRELAAHLELEAAEREASGLSPDAARHAALRAFGNPAVIAEQLREIWSLGALERLARDLRYGARALRKSPGFTAVAVLTLALGIGTNTAIFSAIEALMLRPLPLPAADRLVRIFSTRDGVPLNSYGNPGGPSPLDVRDFALGSHSFEQMVDYDTWRKNVSFGSPAATPDQMVVGLVPAGYFQVLGVRPLMGRLFAEEENQVGRHYVAAIGANLWRTRFAGDRAVLGRKIYVNDEPFTIVAVMPESIPDWMERAKIEVWTPFALPGIWEESERAGRGYGALARMKPGVSLESAQADLAAVAARLAASHPVDRGIGVVVKRLADTRVGELLPMLLLLMGAVSLILLIACVNLANLLLARNSVQQRELALRAALGAGRGGLVRQLLAETLMLSLAGGAVGLLLVPVGLAGLARMHARDLPQLGAAGIDARVLGFTLAVSLATSLLFGLAPALSGTRLDLVDALKQGGRAAIAGRAGRRMRHLLVVAELAMSLVLLIGASLLVQSSLRLQRQDLGIRQDHLLKAHFFLPGVHYPSPEAITRFCDQFGAEVRALPGVVDAAVTTVYPPSNRWAQMLGIPGRPVTGIQDVPMAQFGVADMHFLRALGVPLLRGRDFTPADAAGSPAVALVSQELVRRYFPDRDPIGRQIHVGPPAFLHLRVGANTLDDADVSIVGVIGDFRNRGLAQPPAPQLTVLYAQHPLVNYGFKDIVIRTAAEPRQLVPSIRRLLHDLDPDLPLAEVQTFDELVERQTGGQRFTSLILTLFALAGLSLSVVGIYGVISFLVAQRHRELAVRIAMGANRLQILRLVLLQGLGMAVLGAGLGLAGAWAARRATSGILFGISPLDPATLATATLLLLAVALLATAVPGTRALQIDPAKAMRED